MKHIKYKTSGTCAQVIDFDLSEDNTIHNLSFLGGCNGNLKAISKLVEGKNALVIASILKGNICGYKQTSCADQLSKAIYEAIGENTNE